MGRKARFVETLHGHQSPRPNQLERTGYSTKDKEFSYERHLREQGFSELVIKNFLREEN